jgi:hypothetical protein
MSAVVPISKGRSTLIGFSTPRHFNPVSWLVRNITKSECSHSFFVYWDDDFECDMVLEAHELGFRLIALPRFVKKNRIVALVEPAFSLDPGFLKLGSWVGSAYDFGGLIGQAVVQFGRFLQRKWRNPFHSAASRLPGACSGRATRTPRASRPRRRRPRTCSSSSGGRAGRRCWTSTPGIKPSIRGPRRHHPYCAGPSSTSDR